MPPANALAPTDAPAPADAPANAPADALAPADASAPANALAPANAPADAVAQINSLLPTGGLPQVDPHTLNGDAECCSPLTREAISAENAEELARAFKAIADPARLRLISLVASHADAEACVCDLTGPLGLSQGTVSHHLKILVDANIFSRDKRGTWAYYRLVPGALSLLADRLVSA